MKKSYITAPTPSRAIYCLAESWNFFSADAAMLLPGPTSTVVADAVIEARLTWVSSRRAGEESPPAVTLSGTSAPGERLSRLFLSTIGTRAAIIAARAVIIAARISYLSAPSYRLSKGIQLPVKLHVRSTV